jgi:multiple sugar transport system permease protein
MKISHAISRSWRGLVIIIFCGWSLFPIWWALSISLKTERDALTLPPALLFVPKFQAYVDVIVKGQFLQYFTNSVVIAVSTTLIALLIGIPTSYVLARYKFNGSQNVDFWILSTRMAPPVTILIPFFVLFRTLHLIDTYQGMVLIYLTISLPLVIWVMKGFFQEVPKEIEEAGLVDGCSYFQAFRTLILPVALPGIGATAILSFLFTWNELMFALVLTSSRVKTAPVGMLRYLAFQEIFWTQLTAAVIIMLLPAVIFVALTQRSLIRGLTLGAAK